MISDGELLREYIESEGLNRSKVAEELGVSRQGLYNFYDSQELTQETKDKFTAIFGVDIFTDDMRADMSKYLLVRMARREQDRLNRQTKQAISKLKAETDYEREGITYIPISAQAGYSRKIIDPMFKSNLQKIFIPGMPYRGENYRIWEVEGNSMEPTFKEGFHVLTERIEPEYWHQVKRYYAYVIVTESEVMLKRIDLSKTTKDAWVLYSDNEMYPEFLQPISLVRELWLVKRKMDWEMSPPKRFESKL